MEEASQTLLDGDQPLIKFNSSNSKWCCMLCKRQFPGEKQLGNHLAASDLHRTNLAEAEVSGRIRRPSGPSAAATSAAVPQVPDSGRKRPLESEPLPPSTKSRLSSMDGLRQMEEFEKALQAKAGGAAGGGKDGKPVYRDRAKERREMGGSAVPSGSTIRSARDINGNLDWRCSHCNKLNFAREVTPPRLSNVPNPCRPTCPSGWLSSRSPSCVVVPRPDRVHRVHARGGRDDRVPGQLRLPEAATPRDAQAGAAARAWGTAWSRDDGPRARRARAVEASRVVE